MSYNLHLTENHMRFNLLSQHCFFLDTGSNNSGYYELQAVLTHQGRSSSSGHYVAWVKRRGGQYIPFVSLLFCLCFSTLKHKKINQVCFKSYVFYYLMNFLCILLFLNLYVF